ncbi:MFS transporter [Paenibacillus athensensis]|uniref:MFS transporter n=1 Tax=Paenibacillus athensensis TaxID=1967502 RepID=A0A4Y8QAB2_9BACL|nr:MFS transporter [Paenibacillus athensensis]MCD1259048.1 MFS transporter [Paenibacillus athensensis]
MKTSNTVKWNDHLLKPFTFSFFMTMGIVVSFFPLYFDYKGYTKLQIGMLYAIGPLIGIATNLLWGILSDKFQTVKRIMLVLLVGQAAAALLVFSSQRFVVLYLCLAVFFFFQQPVNSLNDSQLMLHVGKTRASYASFRIWGSSGFAFAAGAFGLLLKTFGYGLTPWLCLTTIGLSLLLAVVLKDAPRQPGRIAFGGMLAIVRQKRFLWFLLLICMLATAHRMNDGFLAVHMRQLGAPATLVGYAWMASSLSEIPIFFLLSRFGHRYKELPLLAFAGLAYTLRFTLVALTHDPVWIIFIQMLHSLTFGIFLFTAVRYLQSIVPDQYRASGQAIFTVAWSSVAGLISGTLGGYLFDEWGGTTLYYAGAGLSLLAALGFAATHALQTGELLTDSKTPK